MSWMGKNKDWLGLSRNRTMNRTEMNKVARKRIAEIAEKKNIQICEIGLPGCMRNFGIAPAHRNKRVHYKSAEELADYNEWVAACQWCHDKIEVDRVLTEAVFKRLRPEFLTRK